MVFAHGYGCDQHVWSDLINAFAADFRIVTFDYVGSGQSDLSAYSRSRYSSLNGYVQDLLEIYEELTLRDTILIAHSVSCMVAVLAAIKQPEYFSRLVLIGPSPRYINDEGYTGGFEQEDLEGLLEMMDNNYLGWSAALAPQIMGNPERPGLSERLKNSFCATDPEIARQFAKVTFLSDNRSDLGSLGVPSLILQSSEDIIAPLEVGEYTHAELKDSTIVVLKSKGHCPHMSEPDEVVASIKSYLLN